MEGALVNRSFATPGVWDYSLTVTDMLGAGSTLGGAISVYNHTPVPSFIVSPGNGTVATAFMFISTVFDPETTVTNTTWFFSDGYRAFGRVATHGFADDTGYDINCTVTFIENGTERRASATRTLLIENTPPTAAFTATAGSAAKRQLVGFDATATTDPDEELGDAAFAWAFGDGATGAGKMAAHPFARGGVFNVTLTVTDERGAFSTFTLPIQVINQLPLSAFAAPVNVTCNQSFTLDASASRDPDGKIVEYSWAFDDGTFANGVTVTYAFSKAGQHTVSLVVTDDDGACAVSEKTIRADAAPSTPGPRPRPSAGNPGPDGRLLVAAGLLALLLVLVAALAVLSRRKGPAARAGGTGAPTASQQGTAPQDAPSPAPEPPARPPEAVYHDLQPARQALDGRQVQESRQAQPTQSARQASADSAFMPPPVPAVTHHRPPKVVRAVPPPPPRVVGTAEPPGQPEAAVVRSDGSAVANVTGPGAPPERQAYSSSVPDESWRLTPGAPVKGHAEARPAQRPAPVLPIQQSEGEADPTLPFNPWATRKK